MNTEKYCLLVDDDPEDQEIFMDALHEVSSNTGCYAVSNGHEALRTLQDDDVSPDYIFTDLQMPVMDGLNFLKALRSIERFKYIPVIVLSSDVSAIEEQIKPYGVTATYQKTRQNVLKEMLKKYFPDSQDSRPTL